MARGKKDSAKARAKALSTGVGAPGTPPAGESDAHPKTDESDPLEMYRVYVEQRKILLDAEQTQAANYDKWILTLSGGAIAVSMTFVRDLIGSHPPSCVLLLGGGWIALALALGTALASIYGSQKAHEQYKELLDQAYMKHGAGFLDPLRREQDKEVWPKAIDRLNKCSVTSFIIGLLMLCSFAAINAAYGEINSESSRNSTADIQECQRKARCKSAQSSGEDSDSQASTGRKEGSTTNPAEQGESEMSQPDSKPTSAQSTSQTTAPPTTIRTDFKTIDIGAGSLPPKAPAPLPKPPIAKDK